MPELPDLLYIRDYLRGTVTGLQIREVAVRQPVVLRQPGEGSPAELLTGRHIISVELRGPFLIVELGDETSIVINLMLAGAIQHQRAGEAVQAHRCVSLLLSDGTSLHLCDRKRMMKVYLVPRGRRNEVPRFAEQGIDILSYGFREDAFLALLADHVRKQVRAFLNDQTLLSAIGNAYADEILFEARLHPKTIIARIPPERRSALFAAIHDVLERGTRAVREAGKPIHVKVRDHLLVRNRKGEPCPRCSATIRREGVRGYDVYFCPQCQPPTRSHFIDWRRDPSRPA